uniref:Uncharacterized protein n=1 Tax=Histophilus somni (strain 129Pt) TaxID=205914 RepID=Q0I5S6_HISS1
MCCSSTALYAPRSNVVKEACMNWWLLGVSSVLVLAAGTFTALVYWANWDLISGKNVKADKQAKPH